MTTNVVARTRASVNVAYELAEIASALNLGRMAAVELSDGQAGDLADLARHLELQHVRTLTLLKSVEAEDATAA